MGHHLLGTLPTTKKWRAVIELISGGAEVDDIAAATSRAAESSMIDAVNDPAFKQGFWLLTQIPQAAPAEDFALALRNLGLEVSDKPTLVEICMAMMISIEQAVPAARRTDAGEMAQLSSVESLSAVASREMGSLFGPAEAPAEARSALARLSTVKNFGALARDYFSRLTRRYLDYYLSRELSQHVGINQRFLTVREHSEFEEALERYCYEAALIVRDFAGDWFSKANYEGGITPTKAGRFVHHAFEKLRDELMVRRGAGA
jgi:hypothetical protein